MVNFVMFFRGNTGKHPGDGGGSGGSIWIVTTNLAGRGFVSVKGGQGYSGSGGGSGGYIAIYYAQHTRQIVWEANGGKGAVYGASGSIYRKTGTTRQLTVDGGLVTNAEATMIACPSGTNIEFTEVQTLKAAKLHIQTCGLGVVRSVFTDLFTGDSSSETTVGRNQELYIAYKGESSFELSSRIAVLDGGLLQVPHRFLLKTAVSLLIGGSLIGATEFTIQPTAEFIVQYPGHTGLGGAQNPSVSKFNFASLLIETDSKITTRSTGKVQFIVTNFQLQYGGSFPFSAIPMNAANQNIQTRAPPLGRNSCPYGHEIVDEASATVHDPCGTGRLIYSPRNVSYFLEVTRYHNVSFLVNITDENGTYVNTSIKYKLQPYLVNETRWKIVYNISCDYSNFKLLVGQVCTLKAGNYQYNSLEIRQDATMYFETVGTGINQNKLTVSDLKIASKGRIVAKPHQNRNRRGTSYGIGGSFGGTGGSASAGGIIPSNVYGNLQNPVTPGESGGGTQTNFGKGGGQMHLIVLSKFALNGAVEVNGGSGKNGAGGGSGGSLFIEAKSLQGIGSITANGGPGHSTGGGGGGGRICLKITSEKNEFKGRFVVNGGSGYKQGNPGTIFIQELRNGKTLTTLRLNGKGKVNLPPSNSTYIFDVIELGSAVSLHINSYDLVAQKLKTDYGCSLNVGHNTVVTINSTEKRGLNCDFNVKENGSFVIGETILLRSLKTVSAVVEGILSAPSISIDSLKVLEVQTGGRLKTGTLSLGKSAKILLHINSYLGSSKYLFYAINSLVLSTDASLIWSASDVHLNVGILKMAYSSKLASSSYLNIHLNATEIQLENNAHIIALGITDSHLGAAGGNSSCGLGAGHGGQGGGIPGGKAYGTFMSPRMSGSVGGSTSSATGGKGGGVVTISCRSLRLDGLISVNGEPGTQSSGGGSGGSILIKADLLTGHGHLTANGGSSQCGGGSGGRIALHIIDRSKFKGVITAYGGNGWYSGAAGTIFVKEKVIGLDSNVTEINNNGIKTSSKTFVIANTTNVFIHNLIITKQGKLAFDLKGQFTNSELTISILKTIGDLSGILQLQPKHTLSFQASKAFTERPFMLPCSVIVQNGSTLILSSKIFITRTTNLPSLFVSGRVVGSEDLIVGEQGQVIIASTGKIGIATSVSSVYSFRSINILSGGRLQFGMGNNYEKTEVNSEAVKVGYGGLFEGGYLTIKTPSLVIAFNGRLSADRLGYLENSGLGAGGYKNGKGSGGSYGGYGGSIIGVVSHKRVYGSLYYAKALGSGGGSGAHANTGGRGGGTIECYVTSAQIDGVISANGGPGLVNGGGGSGGSIHMEITKSLTGLGAIQSVGGDGHIYGGGGSGGRISVHANFKFAYQGGFNASGGFSQRASSGAPGTIYIKDILSGYIQHNALIITNHLLLNYHVELSLNQSNVADYKFDEVTLMGQIILHLDKNMITKKVNSDVDSVFHVPDNVILTAEETKHSSELQSSFHVDTLGEVRLAEKTTFLGKDNRLLGTITGVFDFNIGETKTTSLSISGRTAHFKDGKYTFLSNRGEYKFVKVTLQNRAKLLFENSASRQIPLTLASLEMHYGSTISAGRLSINAGDVYIFTGATIAVSGAIKSTSVTHTANGGSHCGYGGGSNRKLNRRISSVFPNTTGESGGKGGSGYGGGVLIIRTKGVFQLDGTLQANGFSSNVSGYGGGSAGSIFVDTRSFTGLGKISANGGDGMVTGSGGGGGCIAVHSKDHSKYTGVFTAYGGKGQIPGGSGTIYREDSKSLIPRKALIVKNPVFISSVIGLTMFAEESLKDITIDQLDITGSSQLEFHLDSKLGPNNIFLKKLNGDGKGIIRALTNQKLMIEVTEAETKHIVLTANVIVDEGATLVLASNLTVDGAYLNVNGILANVRSLTVESRSRVYFGPKSQTGILEGSQFQSISRPGVQQFGMLELKSTSILGGEGALKMNVGYFIVKTGVKIHRTDVELQTDDLRMERGSVISTTGLSPLRWDALSAGQSSNTGASGGGHASGGGNSVSGIPGGSSVGSIYTPRVPGSPGGNGTKQGGLGGGRIKITANKFNLDGTVEANGAAGMDGSNSGGGSGGGVLLEVTELFSGGGSVTASGGDGNNNGGGGSGGIIAVFVTNTFSHYGILEAFGGRGKMTSNAGGPGTIYTQVIKDKLPFKVLKIDNRDQSSDRFIVLNENQTVYNFDELHLLRKASLTMSSNLNTHLTLKVKRLFGDNSGLIHVQKRHSFYYNYQIYRKGTARLAFNLKVDNKGEVFLADTTYILGSGATALEANGMLTGIQNLVVAERRTIRLYPGARTKRYSNGKYLISPEGSYHFSSVLLSTGSTMSLEGGIGIDMVTGSVTLKYGAKMKAKYFKLVTSEVDIESGSVVDCFATVTQIRPDTNNGEGAPHGSFGGKSTGLTSKPFGSYVTPNSTGYSGGKGSGSSPGGAGGGSVHIEAGRQIIIDGTITVDGSAANGGSSGGGGSGGSIYITTYEVKGQGTLTAKGGNGDITGGGGSGGRIAVHSLTESKFYGQYFSLGGAGGRSLSNSFGGPGTIYITDYKYKLFHNHLRIDNSKRLSLHPIILDEFSVTDYKFNEIYLWGGAKLKMSSGTKTLKVDIVKGDRTGVLNSLPFQTFFVETDKYSSAAPVNFLVEKKSKLILTSVVRLIGDYNFVYPYPQASLVLHGLLDGVRDMVVSKRKRFYFVGNAHTSFTENGTYTIEAPGTFRFPLFELQDGSKFELINVTSMKCTVGNFHLKYGVSLVSDIIDISATNFQLEDGSKVTAAGDDRPGSIYEAPLPSSCKHSGGSHASMGGAGTLSPRHLNPVGSVYNPNNFGLRGCPGGNKGGVGGGSIRILVTNRLYIDGTVTVDGQASANGYNSGGGAGGSVLIRAETLEGHGSIRGIGGAGNGKEGAGGSGGRIAIHLKKQIKFLGQFMIHGGKAGDPLLDRTDKGGGPGTVYISDYRKGYPYHQLRIDNKNRGWSYYVTLNESKTNYEFSEVHLLRGASIHIVNDSVQRNLTIHKIIGDRSGFIHVHNNQVLFSEVKDARTTTIRTPANFKLDPGSEAIMPTVIHIVGVGLTAFDWNGRLTNVLHLHIAYKRTVLIGPKSHTSLIINNERLYIDDFGTFRMSTLEFGSGSFIAYPPPMGVKFTIGLLVSNIFLRLSVITS